MKTVGTAKGAAADVRAFWSRAACSRRPASISPRSSATCRQEFAKQIPGEGREFTATGISLVLHPRNPMVPTVHANFRFLTKGRQAGGSAAARDLTPYYPFSEDVIHFHRVWRDVCDRHASRGRSCPHEEMVRRVFLSCTHRHEPRGVGGIFFDYLEGDFDQLFAFVRDAGDASFPSYLPIAERRKD